MADFQKRFCRLQDQSCRYVLDVLVADAVSGKVIARSCHEAAIVSDALKFSGVTLDTARYQLAPGLRAFGVRTQARYGSIRSAAKP